MYSYNILQLSHRIFQVKTIKTKTNKHLLLLECCAVALSLDSATNDIKIDQRSYCFT